MAPLSPPVSGRWSTSLFACHEDCQICWCVLCCPCVQIGRNSEIITEGVSECCTAGCLWYVLMLASSGLCGWLYTCGQRRLLRAKYQLAPQPCGDALAHLCCMPCAVCQEARELRANGWNPMLGYTSNLVQFQQLHKQPNPMEMLRV